MTSDIPARIITASDLVPQQMPPIELPSEAEEGNAETLQRFLRGIEDSLGHACKSGSITLVRVKAPKLQSVLASEVKVPIPTEFFSVGIEVAGRYCRYVGVCRLRYLGTIANVVLERKELVDPKRSAVPYLVGELLNTRTTEGEPKEGGPAGYISLLLGMGGICALIAGEWLVGILGIAAFGVLCVVPESMRQTRVREREELSLVIDHLLVTAYSNYQKERIMSGSSRDSATTAKAGMLPEAPEPDCWRRDS